MKTLRGRQYSLKQQIQIKLQNKVLGLLASDMDDSLTKAALQLPFSCIGPFATMVMFLIFENTER
jgi:hypothetical protein